MTTATVSPRQASARGSDPVTSASPPVLANPTTSDTAISTRSPDTAHLPPRAHDLPYLTTAGTIGREGEKARARRVGRRSTQMNADQQRRRAEFRTGRLVFLTCTLSLV